MRQRTLLSSASHPGNTPHASAASGGHPAARSPVVPEYELLRLIGSGAYGEVWLARSVTGASRAVKVVYRRRFEDQRPFEREFKGILKFEPVSRLHSSQLAVLHVGRNDDYFYYVMELADDVSTETGERKPEAGPQTSASGLRHPVSSLQPELYVPKTLKNQLARRDRLPFDECLRIALSLTTALEHLHQHGLVHRDIKPSNIIFVGGIPKLADIGLVADMDATLSFVGTEGFVPPEGSGTPQADIYSLGKVFYEMCTGRDRQEFPELPTELRATSDREALVEMNEIILKACEHDPRKRYQATEEMHADLALLQAGKSVRRARGVEKQLRALRNFGMGAATAIGVIAAAWIYQQRQTREARYWAEQSRQRLVRLHSAQGIQKFEDGDFLGSLPWLVEAMKLDQGSPAEDTHRFRLGAVLRQSAGITAFWQTPEPAHLIEVSPDRKSILTVRDRTVHVSDLAPEQPRTPPLEHSSKVLNAAFSPDSDRIVTSTEQGEAIIWEGRTGQRICGVNQEGAILKLAVFSPEGNRMATAGHSTTAARSGVRVWDVDSGKALTPLMECDGIIKHLLFSPNGLYLASAGEQPFGGIITIWDSNTGRPASGPHQHAAHVRAFHFSPDSRSVYAGDHLGAVTVWDVASSDSRKVCQVGGLVHTLAFSPDGIWLAAGTDSGSGLVHDVRTGKAVGPGVNHKRPVRSVGFSPDGRYLLTASDDATARVWHIRSGQLLRPPLQHESKLRRAAFFDDGRGVVTIAEQTVRLWDFSLTHPILHSFVHHEQATIAELSPDARYLVTATDRTGQLWDFGSRQRIGPLLAHDHKISAAAFSPDSRFLATASEDKTARIWDVATGHPVAPPLLHGGPVNYVLFHPNQPRILTASGRSLRVWDAANGQTLGPALELSNRVTALVYRPGSDACIIACEPMDGRSEVLTINTDPTPRVIDWKLWPGKVLRLIPQADRILLAGTGNDLTVQLWDCATGLPVSPRFKHEHPVTHFAANPNRTQAAISCADGSVRVWDLRSGELMGPPLTLAHLKGIGRCEYSPDGRFLVTVSSDGQVRLWELAPEHRPIHEIELLASALSAQEMDATDTAVSLSPSRLEEIWRQLKATSAVLKPSSRLAAAWHLREAEDCEAMGQHERPEEWQGALFHRSRADRLKPGSTTDFLRRAVAHAHVKDWDKAKADYQMALAQGERPDYAVPDQVLLQIIAGDTAGYRDSCRRLMARFGTTKDPLQANDAVWLCCLLPDALPTYELPVRMMRHAAKQRPALNHIFNTFGAVLFRAREYQEAIRILHEGIGFSSGEGTPFDFVFLAMAHQAVGQTVEARSFLDKAIRSIDTPDPDRKWRWEVELGLLRKEAEQELSSLADR